jgi:hypothetical protein
MLIIKYKQGRQVQRGAAEPQLDLVRHIGEKIEDYQRQGVESVSADCDELVRILRIFKNIPTVNKNHVTWTGEIAQFIVEHF